jgi:hypothetical protein
MSPGGSPRALWFLASNRAARASERAIPTAIDYRTAASATAGGPPRPAPSALRPSTGLSGWRRPYQPSGTAPSSRRLKVSRGIRSVGRRYCATPRCSHPSWTIRPKWPGATVLVNERLHRSHAVLSCYRDFGISTMYKPTGRSSSYASPVQPEPRAVRDWHRRGSAPSIEPGQTRRQRLAD